MMYRHHTIILFLLLTCTVLWGQRRGEPVFRAVEVGGVVGLQELRGQVRGVWRMEGALQLARFDVGVYTSALVADASLDNPINLRQGGFMLRYRQPVLPFLTVYAGGRLGWGTAAGRPVDNPEEQEIDGLRTETLEAGLQVHLGPRLSLEAGSAFQWLQRTDPVFSWTADDRRGISTTLGIRWRFLRTAPDKSQPGG